MRHPDPLFDWIVAGAAEPETDPSPCCVAGASEPSELHAELGHDYARSYWPRLEEGAR